MATVKGDVHDIGKNIVGVVLGCNNYEVIDLGVMVPCEKILADARSSEKVDIDRPVGADHAVARRDGARREGDGAAAASSCRCSSAARRPAAQHTAVKIAPEYREPTVHVLDASRAVGVVCDAARRRSSSAAFDAQNREEQAQLRELHAQQAGASRCCRYERRAAARREDRLARRGHRRRRRSSGAARSRLSRSREIVPYIDWTFFFTPGSCAGSSRRSSSTRSRARRRASSFDDAQKLLAAHRRREAAHARAASTASGRPARDGDDIVLYDRRGARARAHALPHAAPAAGQDESDEARRTSRWPTSWRRATAGCATTSARSRSPPASASTSWRTSSRRSTTTTARSSSRRWPIAWPRRSPRCCTSACAASGATAPSEKLSNEDLIAEKYRGIRPAFGYPACPDHTEKAQALRAARRARASGITLTESFAMMPAASVSGIYFAHPEARYFSVGRDRAGPGRGLRGAKGMPAAEVERWLGPNLGYEPAAKSAAS